MEKECRKDMKDTMATMGTKNTRDMAARNRAKAVRRARVRKRLLQRMVAVTILIGLGIAGIFALTNSQNGSIQEESSSVEDKAEEKTVKAAKVVKMDTESTSAVESQGDTAEDKSTATDAGSLAADVGSVAILHDTPDTDALSYPFNQMSADWAGEDLNGWWRYSIPGDFERTGGYLPDIVQVYTYCLCKQSGIRYSLVLALIEIESGYQYDALSETNDIGYMQVNYKWQQDKMPDMTERALYNPYVNIRVGIGYLAELSEEFTTEEAVLTAYHYGPSGAYNRCYKDASITSDYADKVLEASTRIEGELKAREAVVKGGHADAALD